jgi:hypothetical protein
MRAISFCLVAMIPLAAVAGASQTLDPEGGAVLPTSLASALLIQCSRIAPQDISGTWSPSPRQIRDLEVRLPQALSGEAAKRSNTYIGKFIGHYVGFNRQYAGILIAGRKVVYVNAFPQAMVHSDKSDFVEAPDWRSSPVTVCDGGPEFFGVEFDPETEKFEDFSFNGIA